MTIYPVLAAKAVGLSGPAKGDLLSSCVFVMGLATKLQCLRSRFGGGYLITCVPSPNAIPLVVQALGLGGVAMMAASTFMVGLSQLAMARMMRPLRVLLPTEVRGVAMTILGVSLADSGVKRAMGIEAGIFALDSGTFLVAMATLAIMVCVTVFAPRRVKICAYLFGAVLGWRLARFIGVDARDLGEPWRAPARWGCRPRRI